MTSFIGAAQMNLNEYKYIIVPKKFETFKTANQHQTSTLIKYLFSQKNFLTVYGDNLPEDLRINRCLGLKVDLKNNSSMFTTKTILELKDCNGNQAFLTQEGRSKKKDYREAFKEAITTSFTSFTSLNYSYEPKEVVKKEEPVTISFKNDVKTVEEPSKQENDELMVEQISTKEVQYYKDHSPIESNYKKGEPVAEKKMVEQKATKEEQSFKSMEPVQTDYNKQQPISTAKEVSSGTLYAQEMSNGYQLVDSTPKIQLKIFKSSMPNVYIAKADGRDGVVYSSDGKWFFEYHEENQIVKEELNIKF